MRATKVDKALYRELLNKEQPVSKDSLFNDDLFKWTLEDILNRNEIRVIQNIGRLIVSVLEEIARRETIYLKHLIETVDKSWIKFIPLIKSSRPQPDFTIELKSSIFISN